MIQTSYGGGTFTSGSPHNNHDGGWYQIKMTGSVSGPDLGSVGGGGGSTSDGTGIEFGGSLGGSTPGGGSGWIMGPTTVPLIGDNQPYPEPYIEPDFQWGTPVQTPPPYQAQPFTFTPYQPIVMPELGEPAKKRTRKPRPKPAARAFDIEAGPPRRKISVC